MSLKKTVAVLLALILALSTTVCAAESFADVAEDAYYTQAVDWAAEKGIALGKGNGAFAYIRCCQIQALADPFK